ncbi:hypothetical protein FNU79_11605 [Deinococcus detaillensis]|uniref:Blue (type 1) copper domain-containing protein n=1 Tax=Deinococcus detaillensis TaxID=2592048 RepID=A0A553UUJ2_9DEIO|nr:plastocyanin/azurin family copper-binding protein [Deinococcus detaillensis]TSA83864.1 hypothetical protein FNU79_11605 [Deinococcus detaillensis]
MLPRLFARILVGCAALNLGFSLAAPAAVYPFRHNLPPTLEPQAAGQLTVQTLASGRTESLLSLSGLTPQTAYMAHYHALGAQPGASACDSDGPVTLGFPAFKADAQGRASVKLSAAPNVLAGNAGAYVNVHLASDPASVPLCAAVLKVAVLNGKAAPVNAKAAPAPVSLQKISIIDNAFRPPTLSIKVGDTVTWTHDGQITHNVKSTTAAGPQSGDLHHGDTYSFTFKQAGTYLFYCSYHEGMSGTITVTNR